MVLARIWHAGDIGVTILDGDSTEALKSVEARVLVMPSSTAQYFQLADSEVEMKQLRTAELAPIETF